MCLQVDRQVKTQLEALLLILIHLIILPLVILQRMVHQEEPAEQLLITHITIRLIQQHTIQSGLFQLLTRLQLKPQLHLIQRIIQL